MTDDQNLEAEELEELPQIDPSELEDEDDDDEIVIKSIEEEQAEEEVEEPLTLVGEDEIEIGESKILAAGQGALGAVQTEFKRSLNLDGTGATRCKMFHSKISAVPLEYMEKQINEWLDNSEAEVKFVSKVVGIMEGKRPEPNIIVTVWY